MRGLQWCAGRLVCLLVVVATLAGAGCGGGGGLPNNLPAVMPQLTGTFHTSSVKVLVGGVKLVSIGDGYVTLTNGVPVEVGFELPAGTVTSIPQPAYNVPAIYGVPLPPESVYTPFAFLAFSYWSAHDPKGIGNIPHIHPLFALFPPGQPDPPNNTFELMPVAPAEIPQDFMDGRTLPGGLAGETLAPGIGTAYEDPIQPPLQPGWDTIGQNYFFYKGHMNGIGLGATNDFLAKQEQGQEPALSAVIKQPQTYPKSGYYPHKYTVSYDPSRQVHVFALQDFQQAANVLVQRVRH